MNLQVLVSTMHQNDYSLLEKMNISSDAIVINQCSDSNYCEFAFKNKKIKWIDTRERGLSKSRNKAIYEADGQICVLADDDLEYLNDYEIRIKEQFQKYPEVDLLIFQVEGIEKEFKKYSKASIEIDYISSMKIASVQIAFRLDKIKEKSIIFDELFGAGSKYHLGEDNIFLFDCLKNKLKIKYLPIKIADLHIGDSSWFKGFDKDYFVSKGAAFYRMTKFYSILLILQFAVRKHKLYSDSMSLLSGVRYMIYGRKLYASKLNEPIEEDNNE